MLRLSFLSKNQTKFFQKVLQRTRLNISGLAIKCDVHPRSMHDWYSGKINPPLSVVEKVCEFAEMAFPKNTKILDAYWYTSRGGKIGGKNRMKIYGNFGTAEGRKKGGTRSVIRHKQLGDNFVQRKVVLHPRKNQKLAELFGIILGDGHINRNSVSITLNCITDLKYSRFVTNLFFNLFGVRPNIYKYENYLQIVLAGKNVVEFLTKNGLMRGSKVKNQADVPTWIKINKNYTKYCLRGLVDTDGCIYFDRHSSGGRLYKSICLDFTNHSMPLLRFVDDGFRLFGFKVTGRGWNVRIRRREDIKGYYNKIGFSNYKHEAKVVNHFQGEVA